METLIKNQCSNCKAEDGQMKKAKLKKHMFDTTYELDELYWFIERKSKEKTY